MQNVASNNKTKEAIFMFRLCSRFDFSKAVFTTDPKLQAQVYR